ncbi:MAG: RNA methyltransferase [Clostridia bacterium]|nr:RNA methyltransferase [Clostridia bacterium]
MITSKDNEMIKEAAKLIAGSKERRKKERFVAEGVRLCRDAADSGAHITEFFYTAEAAEKNPDDYRKLCAAADRSYELGKAVYNKISDTGSPQGFMCIIDTRLGTALTDIEKGKKYAALENIQDPSNLGTILRTAEAVGADGVILSSDCCDIFSPKVVRGSMGAVFRLPFLIAENFTAYIKELTGKGIPTFASTPRNADNIQLTDFTKGGIMLIGNEGNGLREETIDVCSSRVMIPMLGRAESLNAAAAAAILLYEMMKVTG